MSAVPPAKRSLFRDFCRFSKALLESGDIDPSYPVLKRVYELEGTLPEEALWRTLLYLTWYDLASADRAWRLSVPTSAGLDLTRVGVLPTGIERRGLRGEDGLLRARRFVEEVGFAHPQGLLAWVTTLTSGRSPEEGWTAIRQAMEAQPFAGPWASYKWADLLKHVHGLPIDAPDIGSKLGEGSGPIPGMVRLTGRTWQECAGSTALQKDLLAAAREAGVPLAGLDQLETCLCNFNSLCKGSYYVGADIDTQQEQFRKAGMGEAWWKARACFPSRYRGERMGWEGERPRLKSAYRDQGRIVNL